MILSKKTALLHFSVKSINLVECFLQIVRFFFVLQIMQVIFD